MKIFFTKTAVFAFFLAFLFAVQAHAEAEEVQSTAFIPWEFEIFAEPDFNSYVVGRLQSKQIEILEYSGNWARVNSRLGQGWVNLVHTPAMCLLDDFFAPKGRNVAVFYKNLDTGFTYVYNPDRVFFAASLAKSNHALYAYALAELGLLDMRQVHTYTFQDSWGGTGILRFMPFGREFTTRELLGFSIRESDNAAFRMLVRLLEDKVPTYHEFVRQIGADARVIRDVFAQNTHARDAGLWMYAIFNYIESDSRFGHYLKADMLNTAPTSHPYFTRWEGSYGFSRPGVRGGTVDTRMLRANYPIARKYGWAGNSFHDAGIVYAPSPYILVILSNMERGAHDLFAEISWFMQDFNHRFFVAPTPANAPIKGPERTYFYNHPAFSVFPIRLPEANERLKPRKPAMRKSFAKFAG